MKKPKWKDTSSFSQSDKERIPNAFEVEGISFRLIVHRLIYCEGWSMSCYNMKIEGKPLKAKEVSVAQEEAVLVVHQRLRQMLKELETLPGGYPQ